MKLVQWIFRHWQILLILVLCFTVLWPLYKYGFIVTDDGDWMIIRLSAFFQSLKEGQFPVRFLGRLNYNYGYPVANFLYPGYLYLGSLIHKAGFSYPDTVKIIMGGSVIGSALIIYKWLTLYFSKQSSFIGTTSFIFAPYLLFDLYKRGSVGELLAIFCVSLLIYAIDASKMWLIPLATTFLIISHNTLGLLFLIVVFMYITYKKQTRTILPLLIGIGISIFFWFPALYEQKYIIFNAINISKPAEYLVAGNLAYLVGWINTIIYCYWLYNSTLKRKYHVSNFILVTYGIMLVLSTPLSFGIWQIPILIKTVQFPFRFLSVTIIFGSWLIAGFIENMTKQKKIYISILLVLLSLQVFPAVQNIKIATYPEGYYTTNEATTTVANEYMPKWVNKYQEKRADKKIEFIEGSGEILEDNSSFQKVDAVIRVGEKGIMRINTIYYPGWGITLNNQLQKIDYSNVSGFMQININPGTYHLKAEFRETISRFIVDIIAALSLVTYVIYLFFLRNHKIAWI